MRLLYHIFHRKSIFLNGECFSNPAQVRERTAPRRVRRITKTKGHPQGVSFCFGDSWENRTPVSALRGPCLSRLTNEPCLLACLLYYNFLRLSIGFAKIIENIFYPPAKHPLLDLHPGAFTKKKRTLACSKLIHFFFPLPPLPYILH